MNTFAVLPGLLSIGVVMTAQYFKTATFRAPLWMLKQLLFWSVFVFGAMLIIGYGSFMRDRYFDD